MSPLFGRKKTMVNVNQMQLFFPLFCIVSRPHPKETMDKRGEGEALLGKWLWRYMNDKDSLWRRVIRSKYGDNGLGWYPSKPSGAYGQSL